MNQDLIVDPNLNNYLPDIREYDYFKFPPLEMLIEDKKANEAPMGMFDAKRPNLFSQSKASPQSTNIYGEMPEHFHVFDSAEIKRMRHAFENTTPMDYNSSNSSSSNNSVQVRKRGPYRKYSANLRVKAIQLCNKIGNTSKVSSIMNIPIKNLRRWIITGPNRKTGGLFTRRAAIS